MKSSTEKKEGEWEIPYIKLEEAMQMADKVKEMGKATSDKLAQAMGEKNVGWFRLKVASVKRWGLIEGWGEMQVTQAYKDIKQEKKPNHALEVKHNLFLGIPLFKSIFDEYKDNGLPQEPYLTNAIADKFGLTGRNPNLVSNIVREFINEHFPNYGHGDSYANIPQDKKQQADLQHKEPASQNIPQLPANAIFPIKIITRERVFDWDIAGEVDWEVVDSAIKSLKDRWKNKASNSNQNE